MRAPTGIINKDGRYVVYTGDDERFDYVYNFVTAGRVDPQNRAANMNLLDDGTLFGRPLQRRRHGATGCRWSMARAR